jgi:hypothetical protein
MNNRTLLIVLKILIDKSTHTKLNVIVDNEIKFLVRKAKSFANA